MANENKLLKAWHASPYDFDRFGPMKEVSGSGQGQAVYGRGAAYVAENPKVSGPGESNYMLEFAEHPKTKGQGGWTIPDDFGSSDERLTLDDSYIDLAHPENLEDGSDWVNYYLNLNHHDPNALSKLMKEAEDKGPASSSHLADFMNMKSDHVDVDSDDDERYTADHAQLVKDYLGQFNERGSTYTPETYYKHIIEGGTGGPFSYEVNVHLKPETMLDWDASMSDHHPEAHDKIFEVHHASLPKDPHVPDDPEYVKGGNWWQSKRGQDVYSTLTRQLGSDYAASEALFNAGIHGIRYKDGGSRDLKPVLHINDEPFKEGGEHDDVGRSLRSLVQKHGVSLPGDIEAALDEHVQFMKDEYESGEVVKSAYDFWKDVQDRVEKGLIKAEVKTPRPTYNYVIFHPDFVEAVAQYNIKGEKVKDLGPGVHLKAVDHDPFKGEK